MRDNCARLHSAAVGTSQSPFCSRGPHLASANQHRHSSDQRFTNVDHLKCCGVATVTKTTMLASLQQSYRTKRACMVPIKKIPVEDAVAQSISFANCVRNKGTQARHRRADKCCWHKQTRQSHISTVQVVMPSPDASEHDISVMKDCVNADFEDV